MRRRIIALLTAAGSLGALLVAAPAGALEASAVRSVVHHDAKDDVRVVPFGSDKGRVGQGSGDIRRVVTRVGRSRVRVAVNFDAGDAGGRLTLWVSFAARKVSGGRGHIAALSGSRATGLPERSFYYFYEGDVGPEDASCPGFKTQVEVKRWVLSVPTSCLQQSRRVKYQEISVQTEYAYDDAYGYDKWPRRGSAKIK